MKFHRGRCIAGMCTMLSTIFLGVAVLICVNYINAENPADADRQEATQYPILLPGNSHYPLVEYLEPEHVCNVDWENGFKKCGAPVEGCPANTTVLGGPSKNVSIGLNASGNVSTSVTVKSITVRPSKKPLTDFKAYPMLCRCDEECVRYGDCCVSVLKRKRMIPKDSHWRCMTLLDSRSSVRMVSKCPSDYPEEDNNINKALCENEELMCPNIASPLCPLLDVPVVVRSNNNQTSTLYKNIFCARCHSISNHEILLTNHTIICPPNVHSRTEWEEIAKRLIYKRGQFRWEDPTNSSFTCKLHIKQLEPDKISEYVPNVRFCYPGAKEDCALDVAIPENLVTASLCYSYTLVVTVRNGSARNLYKNPHCAKCDNPAINITRDPYCERTTPREKANIPALGTRMFSEAGPVGINILFHFSLDMDDGYVGYTSKCEEDEILDFIRHKCVPVICQKGYELIDGQCEKIEDDSGIEDDNDDNNGTSSPVPRDTYSGNLTASNSSEPCFLIIFHNGEYSQLENGSLAVNKSGNAGGVLIFQPGEYQQYEGDDNNMSMSICAKHVEKTFESSFAPALSYISNILLIISVFSALAHVVLYLILPKMRNLPGNNLLCLTSCLLISHFIFLTFINTNNNAICVTTSMVMHYFLLSSFFWSYVMSFDIWRTFATQFLVRRYSGDSKKTFIKYSLFAWTLPLLIVILAALTDFALPDSWLYDSEFGPIMRKLRPLYGHNNLCWIGQRLSLFVFFAFPVGVIILCNLLLFALTAKNIWAQNKEGNRFINGTGTPTNSGSKFVAGRNENSKIPLQSRNSGSTKKSDKVRFKLYAKLALIMGLTWILGLLSGFTQWEWLWYPFVIFNGLQGTFIFVAFDCKKKVWNMVKEECGWRKKKGDTGEGSSGTGTQRISANTNSTTLSIMERSSRKPKKNIENHHQDLQLTVG